MRQRLMRRTATLALALLTGAIVLAPVTSHGAPAVPKAPPGNMDVQLWPSASGAEPGRNVIIVSLQLPSTAKLPARVRIPVPPESQVVWAGEILGGDASQDPERNPKIVNGVGGLVAEFTVEKSRVAQIETVGVPIQRQGDLYSLEAGWVQSDPAKITSFSLRLPAGATGATIEPKPSAQPETNAQGEVLYPLPSQQLKAGESTTITASWTIKPVVKTSTGGGQGGSGPVLIWLLVGALGIAVVALAFVLFRSGGRPDADAGDYEDDSRADDTTSRELDSEPVVDGSVDDELNAGDEAGVDADQEVHEDDAFTFDE